ncbi:helix-turn-helix transcriptional regulator [Tardiphaga sp. vice278]|uniref:helix-turn-helix transcriptional regulator n=1 Tax=Tardiphaga sp. vice278 TaxID=2592815 RepID=UPI001164D894|nr:AlpA family phage regulatory protein [Tardiphaga sp. vice278]QDM19189.1 AlpA family phage regulatory protein [Tardiphaga sp. vice278]
MNEHTKFPREGYVRIWDIVRPNGPIPVAKSTWWAGVKSCRFPQPQKLGPGITVWRASDIWDLINNGPNR